MNKWISGDRLFPVAYVLKQVFPSLAALAVTVVLHVLGMLAVPNGLATDWLMRLLNGASVDDVLLLEAPRSMEAAPADRWAEAAERLLGDGARHVVFTFDPTGDAAPGPVLDGERVTIAREAAPADGGGWRKLGEAPLTAGAGLAILPPSEAGVHRRQQVSVPLADGGRAPTVEALGARRAGVEVPGNGAFLIAFPPAPEALPRAGLERVLAGGMARAVIEGRVAVISFADRPGTPGLTTPMTPGGPHTGLAAYRAVALETLLSGVWVRPLGPWASLSLLALACLAGAVAYARLEPRSWPLAAAAATLAVAGAAAGAMVVAGLALPVATLLVSQILVSLAVWREREVAQERALDRILRRSAAALTPEEPAGGGKAPRPDWAALAAGAARHLGLPRALVLEVGPGGRLKPVAARGCTLADLSDEARNAGGRPWCGLDPAEGPRQVPTDVFAGPPEACAFHAMALADEREVFAYWLVARPEAEEEFAPALAARMRQAALLIADQRARDAAPRSRIRPLDGGVGAAFAQLQERAALFGATLEHISIAATVADPLGRILHVNARMARIVEELGLPPGGPEANDLAMALCGLTQERAAQLQRRVLLSGGEVTLPATREVAGRRWMLRLSALTTEAGAGGLLCELVDVTDPVRLSMVQRTMTEHLGLQLRNDLEALRLALFLLTNPRADETRKTRAAEMLRAVLDRLQARTLEAERHALAEAAGGRLETACPVDALASLRRAVERAAGAAAAHRVQVATDMPELASLVLAAPAGLEWLLGNLLDLLAADAREGSSVRVTMREEPDEVVIAAENDGYAMPGDRLAAVLSGREPPASAEMRELAEGAAEAVRWGGALKGEAEPGQGYRFELVLRRIN